MKLSTIISLTLFRLSISFLVLGSCYCPLPFLAPKSRVPSINLTVTSSYFTTVGHILWGGFLVSFDIEPCSLL